MASDNTQSALQNTTNLTTPSVRSSSRGKNSMKTPSVFGKKQDVGMTPLITPKFNTMTPLNRTVARAAKPNEMLMSLDGSPVAGTLRTKV